MLRLITVAGLSVALALTGCDKAEESAKSMGDATKEMGRNLGDAAKNAAETAKEKAGELGDAAKKNIIEPIQAQVSMLKEKVASLTGAADSVPEAKKAEYTSDVSEINSMMSSLNGKLESLKDAAADQWSKLADEVKAQASTLMEKVNAALAKYNVK